MKMRKLTDSDAIIGTYDVYRHCMYMPTVEKFRKKAAAFLEDESVHVFAFEEKEECKGVIVVSLNGDESAVIEGIAVAEACRFQGIGSYMIRESAEICGVKKVYAETDDDAILFYIKNGFAAEKFSECYDGQEVTRYRCQLKIQ